MQTAHSRLWQAARFCIGGAAGVIAYYAALYCLTEYLGVWYVISSIIGFLLNTAINFLIQKFWTFKNEEPAKTGKQAVAYFILSASLLAANAIFIFVLTDLLGMWYMAAQGILTVVLTIVNFFVSRRIFTYDTPEREKSS